MFILKLQKVPRVSKSGSAGMSQIIKWEKYSRYSVASPMCVSTETVFVSALNELSGHTVFTIRLHPYHDAARFQTPEESLLVIETGNTAMPCKI